MTFTNNRIAILITIIIEISILIMSIIVMIDIDLKRRNMIVCYINFQNERTSWYICERECIKENKRKDR